MNIADDLSLSCPESHAGLAVPAHISQHPLPIRISKQGHAGFQFDVVCIATFPPPQRAGAEQPLLVYVRPEDEFMHKACEWSFAFRIESKQAGTDELQPWRLAMAVPASAVPAAREQLAAAVSAAPEPSSR